MFRHAFRLSIFCLASALAARQSPPPAHGVQQKSADGGGSNGGTGSCSCSICPPTFTHADGTVGRLSSCTAEYTYAPDGSFQSGTISCYYYSGEVITTTCYG